MAHPRARSSRVAVLASLAVVAGLVAGCGNQGGTPSPAPSGPASTAPTSAPTATTPPSPTASATAGASVPTGVHLETVIDGLDSPIWVQGAGDGSGRLFVAEQTGVIRIVRDGSLVEPPFLAIPGGEISAGGERGLLGLAFPPGFGPDRPLVYVHYSASDGSTTVSEFRLADGNPDLLDTASERVVLTEAQPYPNHNGGWLGFDPSGMLLLALGDGGAGGDPENRASDLSSPLGKILRFDVTRAENGKPYGIPPDNPFVGRADALPEILHYGLRNPFRDAFDPATGDLWIGDVGQGAWEEIDVARAGAKGLDFGWRRWEGAHCYNPPTDCDPTGVTMPVAEYSHADGCSVIGGVVYRGTAIPSLQGRYLFSDYCSGTLWSIDATGDEPREPEVLLETGASISSVSTDDDGEVYLTDLGGRLLRLQPGA